jgi:hypothetical protein
MLGTNSPASFSCPSKLSQACSSSALQWPIGHLLSSFRGARESDHQIRSNTSVSKSSTSLLHLLGCLSSERKREAWLICHPVICPAHAQITIKTLLLIGNSERATPAQPFQPRERRGLAFEPESFDYSAFCIPLCRRPVGVSFASPFGIC